MILMLLSNYSFSQLNNYYNSYQINDPINDPISAVRDIVFQNPTIGYVIALYNQSNNTDVCKIFKTTNYGQNWFKICNFNLI